MKKENNFLDLMGEIDEKFVYEASLPWKKRNVNLKLKLAKIAAGVVIALLLGGLGHPNEIKAAWEQITSWIQTALGINENVESYIDSVGKTITKNGISITLDEIAADKENLWVAISDNINDSKEKDTILLTEVEINGKAAQLDGTYALEKKENGTDGQVCHYRLEDTTIKDNTADIKMKVWLFDPTEMDTADTEDETIGATAEDIKESTKDFILKELSKNLKGYDLEEFVADLLRAMGYRTTLSPHGGDGGVDITAYKDELPPRILVQVKSQDGDIKESVLQSLKGALREGDYGTFVTLSNYTKNARKYLDNNPIIRGIDGSNLVDLILAHYERLSEKYQRMIPLEKVYIPVQSE